MFHNRKQYRISRELPADLCCWGNKAEARNDKNGGQRKGQVQSCRVLFVPFKDILGFPSPNPAARMLSLLTPEVRTTHVISHMMVGTTPSFILIVIFISKKYLLNPFHVPSTVSALRSQDQTVLLLCPCRSSLSVDPPHSVIISSEAQTKKLAWPCMSSGV